MTEERPLHPALDFDSQAGRASVGIVDQQGKAWLIIREEDKPTRLRIRKVDAEIEHMEGRIYPAPYVAPSLADRWDGSDRDSFLSQPKIPSLRGTAAHIRRVLLDHLELKRPEEASLITLWIIGTYLAPLFLTYPRLSFLGEKGSGKSKALQLIAALGFNGLHILEPTGAVLFRLIEPLRPTLCLDEMEKLDREARNAVGAIFNAGYKHGARVPRTEERDRRRVVEFYEVYGPLAVASIGGLNGVQEDRAITVIMTKGHNREKINREVNPAERTFGELRAQLYRLALTRHQDVRGMWDTVQTPEWLNGRHRELYKPLLTLADVIAQEGDDSFRRDILRIAESELEDRGTPSREVQALAQYLESRLRTAPEINVQPKEVAGALRQALDEPHFSDVQAGNLLKRCGFERNPNRKRGSVYTVTKAAFIEWAQQHGLEATSPKGESLHETDSFDGPIDYEMVERVLRELEVLTDADLLASAQEECEVAWRRGERWDG